MSNQDSHERGQKQTVLIVDDEEALARAIEATLDQEGLRTVVAHDGDRALELARNLRPDLILLDVMLPGRSGVKVCATLKMAPETSSIPVILISAKAEPADRSVGLAAGAEEYLSKPFNPVELITLVNEVLAGRLIVPRPLSDVAKMPAERDQLVVYAREFKELYEQERAERQALEEARQRLDEVDCLKASFLSVVTSIATGECCRFARVAGRTRRVGDQNRWPASFNQRDGKVRRTSEQAARTTAWLYLPGSGYTMGHTTGGGDGPGAGYRFSGLCASRLTACSC